MAKPPVEWLGRDVIASGKFLLMCPTRKWPRARVTSAWWSKADEIYSSRVLLVVPSRPGEFHPEPLTDPDLTLSRHPARAIARRLPPSIEHRVPPGVGWTQHQLTRAKWRWPAPFAPRALPRFITTTKQSAPSRRIGTFSLAVVAACAFSLGIAV